MTWYCRKVIEGEHILDRTARGGQPPPPPRQQHKHPYHTVLIMLAFRWPTGREGGSPHPLVLKGALNGDVQFLEHLITVGLLFF